MADTEFLTHEQGVYPMKRSLFMSYIITIISLFLMGAATTGCAKNIIRGNVVDSETGQPIEKAALFIEWMQRKGMPGLTYSSKIESIETLSDSEGSFEVPLHSVRTHDFKLIVYKKGYVCWSSERVFPSFEKTQDFSLKDGMLIELETFKPHYSREKHALFVMQSSVGSTGQFFQAIEEERRIEREFIGKKNK